MDTKDVKKVLISHLSTHQQRILEDAEAVNKELDILTRRVREGDIDIDEALRELQVSIRNNDPGILESLGSFLKDLAGFLPPLTPDTIPLLTYPEAIEFFIKNQPRLPFKRGIMVREARSKGYLLSQYYLDQKNNIMKRGDGSPYGRVVIVKRMDNELEAVFGKSDIVIVE